MNLHLIFASALAFCLVGCETVDLGETPPSPGLCQPDPVYFEEVVYPQVIAPADPQKSCVADAGCHQAANGRSALRLRTNDPLSPQDQQQNYDVVTRFLNCGSPEASSFLTKPLAGIDPHGGGDIIQPGSPEEDLFLEWFDDL